MGCGDSDDERRRKSPRGRFRRADRRPLGDIGYVTTVFEKTGRNESFFCLISMNFDEYALDAIMMKMLTENHNENSRMRNATAKF